MNVRSKGININTRQAMQLNRYRPRGIVCPQFDLSAIHASLGRRTFPTANGRRTDGRTMQFVVT